MLWTVAVRYPTTQQQKTVICQLSSPRPPSLYIYPFLPFSLIRIASNPTQRNNWAHLHTKYNTAQLAKTRAMDTIFFARPFISCSGHTEHLRPRSLRLAVQYSLHNWALVCKALMAMLANHTHNWHDSGSHFRSNSFNQADKQTGDTQWKESRIFHKLFISFCIHCWYRCDI